MPDRGRYLSSSSSATFAVAIKKEEELLWSTRKTERERFAVDTHTQGGRHSWKRERSPRACPISDKSFHLLHITFGAFYSASKAA